MSQGVRLSQSERRNDSCIEAHPALENRRISVPSVPPFHVIISQQRRFWLFPRVVIRCLPFFVLLVCATTGLSTTTFPLQGGTTSLSTTTTTATASTSLSASPTNPQSPVINTHGLPIKHHLPSKPTTASSETSSTAKVSSTESASQTSSSSTSTTPSSSKPEPTGNTNLIPPNNNNNNNEEEEEEEIQTNDVEEDEDSEDKDDEKMNVVDDQKFKERIQSSIRTVQNWETVEWLKDCRSIIPWDELKNETGPYSRPEEDRMIADDSNALFLQRLCRWFPKFMTWVNAPPCVKCGCKECEMKTVRGPETEEEKEGNAKRVEVYYCPECKENTTTFPRYNNARKLLETRKGRCGEYSNLFGLFCRAAGFETRLVLDLSDHLWTEVRIGDNWIMADSCEGIIDKPSMYEYGWGKDGLCYMIAIASDHVVDVSPRYSRKFLTDDFQTRRRTHTTSENATAHILRELNQNLQRNLPKAALDELDRRRRLEDAELQICKQSTEWTAQEKYGRGRISGSLAWKRRRQEDGQKGAGSEGDKSNAREVAGFEIEYFMPPWTDELSLCIRPKPLGRHDGIVVGGTACAIGEADSISVVVVDEKCLGCILQSKSFLTWEDTKEFVSKLPPHRIVLMNGKCEGGSKTSSAGFERLGGWIGTEKYISESGIAFIGQVDAHPDWVYCSSLEDCSTDGYEIVLKANATLPELVMKTERCARPPKVAGRLPEMAMPMKTQLLANDEQKRLAFTSFSETAKSRYAGYTTRPGAPVYLLDTQSYPVSRLDTASLNVSAKDDVWNTFLYLPKPLVPDDDNGIQSATKNASDMPAFDVPLETTFFNNSLGAKLISTSMEYLPTHQALHNARLVGYYFSAHWCGPCRSFTPMLAEMYAHLKEERPTHGLEIVFVSGDRDASSFSQYYRTMPWLAVPFEHLQAVKGALNATYGVRGIPSLVILDAVSGQVVASANETRQSVAMACRGGERQIESLLDSWLQRVPQETTEILSMLELSCNELEPRIPSNHEKANPYLLLETKKDQPMDTAARIKEFFEKLVAEGSDPTAAAAKAIGLVAEEQKAGNKLEPGPLDGMAVRMGPISPARTVEHYLERAVDWNSVVSVKESLETAMKYLKNAEKEPWAPKFRSFKLSNKVADRITKLEGGLGLLETLGFDIFATNQDFKAVIPIAMDLEATNQRLAQLVEKLNSR
eukprot:CAMPEP_0176014200 /NCGR_PEP_ID=MMETSP0120_2-20121206/6700_1 /TAXON_ID=160619 /ORGANISM="Kryptoperidinium foliaceum, Strain CCMP 1326" /LENGTH=1189 /DNA_ID=CAMNT_0017347133 /DNA_START=97 /DNA_END=3666 /DNA_ORIENTATION=-